MACIWGTFDRLVFKVILGSFSALKMACNSKTASSNPKQSEIWDLYAVVNVYGGTFDLLVFNVILRSFGALVSKWPLT